MDATLKRPAVYYVLLWVILAQFSPVFPAPVEPSCDINNTLSLRNLLEGEATDSLKAYEKYHGKRENSIPDDVPDSGVSGTTVTEKLLDVCTKHMLFSSHISQVAAFQKDLLPDPSPVLTVLSPLKERLASGHLLARVKNILHHIEEEIPEVTTPAPLQLSYDDQYTKKVYGWGVIVRLVEWLKEVEPVLQEAREVCG